MNDRIMAQEHFLDSATSRVDRVPISFLVARHRLVVQLARPWRWFEIEEFLVVQEDSDAGIDRRSQDV